jgi:hypothetical protein
MKRPTGKKWELVVDVARRVAIGLSIADIAREAGMPTRATIGAWRKQSWWMEAVHEAESVTDRDMVLAARANIARAVQDGCISTSKWLLARQAEDFYSPKERANLGNSAQRVDRPLADLSDEELDQMVNEPLAN